MPNEPSMCPICVGRCTVPSGFYISGSDGANEATATVREPCRTCGGTGIVWANVGAGKPTSTPTNAETVINIREPDRSV
jgi:hypothetical protein